jgi:membrane-associated protease RseP (regulator of RpoE activity)
MRYHARTLIYTIAITMAICTMTSGRTSWSAASSPATTCLANATDEDVDAAIRSATGLRFRTLESIVRRNIISTRTPYGFKIKSVDADSAGAAAGLKKGDVLLEWDGRPLKSRADLKQWLDEAQPGVEIPIKYARLKEKRRLLDRRPWVEHTSTITLTPAPHQP